MIGRPFFNLIFIFFSCTICENIRDYKFPSYRALGRSKSTFCCWNQTLYLLSVSFQVNLTLSVFFILFLGLVPFSFTWLHLIWNLLVVDKLFWTNIILTLVFKKALCRSLIQISFKRLNIMVWVFDCVFVFIQYDNCTYFFLKRSCKTLVFKPLGTSLMYISIDLYYWNRNLLHYTNCQCFS